MPTPSLLSLPVAILQHTPLWVWPLLIYLVVMGLRAAQDRSVALMRPLILPAVFLMISLSSGAMLTHPVTALFWLVGLVCGGGIGVPVARRTDLRVLPDGRLQLPGEWLTLCLTLTIFTARFASGAIGSMAPAAMASVAVGGTLSLIVGICSGLFLGRGIGLVLRALRQSAQPA
tara:strand:- start:340 stop:861 length:522 start_codon:yes stop_codon:yes gene_type:complete